jgi:hypothetical protein
MITNDWNLFQLFHNLLHFYDKLYMTDNLYILELNDAIDSLVYSLNEKQSECLRKIINLYSLDFLVKDDGGYVVPYSIIPEAFSSKLRQYKKDYGYLRKSFEYQLKNNRPKEKISNTIDFPPSNAFY